MIRTCGKFFILCAATLGATLPALAETVVKKDVAKIYAEICSNCHGKNLEGARHPRCSMTSGRMAGTMRAWPD